MHRSTLTWLGSLATSWVRLFATISAVILFGIGCESTESRTGVDESIDEAALVAPGPGACGCEDGNNDECENVRVKQWACSYGPPCNYVKYLPDCSFGSQCPATTWNGCVLQSQVCRDTGLRCNGSCGNGDPCTIQYEDAEPVQTLEE